jgi:O-antigen/teichoic acid export membrane protein
LHGYAGVMVIEPDANLFPSRTVAVLRRATTLTLIYTVGGLLTNLGTGMLTARFLHANGRGAYAAIIQFPSIATWLFGMGAAQSLSYYVGTDEAAARGLLGGWLLLTLPLTFLGIAVEQLLLPTLFHAQSAHTLYLGRIWAVTVSLAMYSQVTFGTALGTHRFHLYNFCSFLSSVLTVAGFGFLALAGLFTLPAALICSAVGSATALVVSFVALLRSPGVARPNRRLLRRSFWYGVKAHFANVSSAVTARLDLVIMPAILAATQVGYYSIATNVAWLIVTLAGALYAIALPIAARQRTPTSILATCQTTLLLATVLVVPAELLAPLAVRLVYGSGFSPAVPALRILLPGSIFAAAAGILWSGLLALGRPLATAIAQAPGLAITLVGLLLYLRKGGIVFAAEISTTAYLSVFICGAILYARFTNISPFALANMRSLRRTLRAR